MSQYAELLQVATEAAAAAGGLIKAMRNRPISHDFKDGEGRDVVTEADVASQKLICDFILSHFPAHGFLAEEEDSDLPESGNVIWMVDPIDGTSNYSNGIPLYSVSIGATVDGVPVVGVIYDPSRDEMFTAVKGGGAFLNNRPIATSNTAHLPHSILANDWSKALEDRQQILEILTALAPHPRTMRGIGSAAIAFAWVACGRLDAYFNTFLGAWDAAAGQVILEEAGATLTKLDGTPFTLDAGKLNALSSNTTLHQTLLDLITR